MQIVWASYDWVCAVAWQVRSGLSSVKSPATPAGAADTTTRSLAAQAPQQTDVSKAAGEDEEGLLAMAGPSAHPDC